MSDGQSDGRLMRLMIRETAAERDAARAELAEADASLRRLSEFVEAVREALDEMDDSRAVVRIIAALGLLDGGE